MSGYHSAQVDVPVRLNTNESPFPPPDGWLDAVADIARSIKWNRYPDRAAIELRETIAGRHGVSSANIFVANGSNEVIQTILLAYGGAGRCVATFEPTYQMYSQIARVTGADVVQGERRADLSLDPMEIERVLTRHKPSVSFLCNPNNPTGLIEPRANLEAMLKHATGIVVVDEAYAEFSEWSAIDMVSEDLPLAVTRTFSKTLSMAALRVGYVVAPKQMISDLEIAVLPYHLDSFKQSATIAALGFVSEMEQRVDTIKSERSRIFAAISEMDCEVWTSGSNFILFRPRSSLASVVWQRMVDSGVLVRDCSTWPLLSGCLRVTVGTSDENTAFLGALSAALSVK
ncbi:MAG: histidinol-phosphate transaminase [Ilumatobacteraceae bacterium]|nr:histidinol-phosphate transaminase [Ilumatobacteraceae bacterium]